MMGDEYEDFGGEDLGSDSVSDSVSDDFADVSNDDTSIADDFSDESYEESFAEVPETIEEDTYSEMDEVGEEDTYYDEVETETVETNIEEIPENTDIEYAQEEMETDSEEILEDTYEEPIEEESSENFTEESITEISEDVDEEPIEAEASEDFAETEIEEDIYEESVTSEGMDENIEEISEEIEEDAYEEEISEEETEVVDTAEEEISEEETEVVDTAEGEISQEETEVVDTAEEEISEEDKSIFNEDGSLKVLNGEEFLALTPEQQDRFNEKYYSLSKEEQENYDMQYAQADFDNYNKNVEQGYYQQSDSVEQDFNDVMEGTYRGDDTLDETVMELGARGAMATLGQAFGADPITKSNLGDQAGYLGKTYGPDVMKNVAQTAYVQYGIHKPTPLVHEDEFGNKTYDYGLDSEEEQQEQGELNTRMVDTPSSTRENNEVGLENDDKETAALEREKYKARINVTPKNQGKWVDKNGEEGDRGEAKWCPSDEYVQQELARYGVDGIEYKDGYPDFSPVSYFSCNLTKEEFLDSDKTQFDGCNFTLLETLEEYPEVAEWYNFDDWQMMDLENGKTPYGYTWHHDTSEEGLMRLVPTSIHQACRHAGGRSSWGGGSKNR